MATYEMKDHTENNNCNRYALNFELLVTLDELDVQYELVCPDSLNTSSDSQKQDDILEDFCIHFADILLPGTKKEEINDMNNTTSRCTEDASSMQETKGEKGKKQSNEDLSFLDALVTEELCMKQPSIHDIETVSPSAKSEVTIITQNNSTSLCKEDTSSVEEKEGKKDQYQNDADLSFLDTLDIEELCVKLPSINNDEIVNPSDKPNVTINTQNNSSSWCTKDTFSMQEKEVEIDQNQNNADFSFLDALDMEDLCVNLPSIDDIEIVKPCAEPKVKIITHRRRKVEPSLRILLLKRLASNAKYLHALS